MFELSTFSSQVVVDQQILKNLRHQSLQSADSQSIGSSYSFSELLEAQIGYHLRGLDLGAKEAVKHAVLNRILENPSHILITQKDIADMVLAVPYPLERRVKNLQNWVTLSTDFTLNFEEISLVTRAYDIEMGVSEVAAENSEIAPVKPEKIESEIALVEPELASVEPEVEDVQTEVFEREPEDILFNPNDKKGNRYEGYAEADLTDEKTIVLEGFTETPETFVWEETPESPLWYKKLQDWLVNHSLYQSMSSYKKVFETGSKLLGVMLISAIAVFTFAKFLVPVSEPFVFTDACHLLKQANHKPFALELAAQVSFDRQTAGMPSAFEYSQMNTQRLKGYLKRKNSVLADEPYFSEVIKHAALNNVNPALLFAITGQEQGFVRLDDPDASVIANNPFNVFHSWKDYNTNISDSADIAAKTIIEISKKKPQAVDSFKWLNKIYAEDANWWIGVEYFYFDMMNYSN